jgi:Protein of unknown function (DUF2914)/Tetratricopeptide repeat
MPELRDARDLLEMAERAAVDGDFSSADQLLRDAARLQEAELGPLHPDLANTLNNLAIVAEKTGRTSDAETFYRRSAAILSESLPADHPMVAESRKNLEDFCNEHGLPIAEATVMTPSAPDTAVAPEAPAAEVVPRAVEPATSHARPAVPRRSSRWLTWVAIAVIGSIVLALLVSRSWSSRQTSTVAPTMTPANEAPQPPAVLPAPVEPARSPKAEPRDRDRDAANARPVSAGGVSLVTVRLCGRFSTSGGQWRCDPPVDPVPHGPMVLYTRVKASRDATIEHRWYRDDTLRQAVKLAIGANTSEGYRTYSRQTVNGAGNWRVEVRSASGELLHEERFAVR